MRKALTLFLATILVLNFSYAINTASANDPADVISTDTTWTKTGSPYTVSGQVTVNDGVTLTVEAGVTVNIGGTLQVNGALIAKGYGESKIVFCGGKLMITPATKQVSVIDNCIMSSSTITASGAVKISHSSAGTITVTGGTPTVTNCSVTGLGYPYAIHIIGGSPTITQCTLMGGVYGESASKQPVISYNNVLGPVQIQGGTPTITHNSITGINRGYTGNDSNGTVQAGASMELSGGIGLTGYNFGEEKLYNAVVTDNVLVGGLDGVCWNAGAGAVIKNNLISNFTRRGLAIGSNAAVCYNTITNNKVGIEIFNFNGDYMGNENAQASPTINYNNILSNQYNIYSYCGRSLDATSNWWGTTNVSAIRETIHDYTFDQALGAFAITPVLAAINRMAYPSDVEFDAVSQPTPTAAPAKGSSQTPSPMVTPANSSFIVESNSTVSSLSFNTSAQEITFRVNGTSGTTGYLKIAISKDLMPNGEIIKVYLDEYQVQYDISESGNNWVINFTYQHSQHQVRIAGATQEQIGVPFSWVAVAAAAVLIALVSSVVVAVVWLTKKAGVKQTP